MDAVEEALADLRILDLSQGIAGPYCTKWFSDFGARVTKVETPGTGDVSRSLGPFPGDEPHPEKSALFLYLNTRKRSLTLDLDREAGQAIFRRLLEGADMVVDDSPTGTMERRGLAYEDLKQAHPGLVFVALSNFGRTGPDRDAPATDLTLAARSGTMSHRMLKGRPPIKMGGAQSLYMGGRSAFLAAMGAVLQRDVTGEGQLVDVSLLEAVAINDLALPTTYSYQGVARQPTAPPATRGRGGMGPYPCKDGHVNVLPGVGGLKKLAAMLGDPSLAEHEWFRDHQLRLQHAQEFDEQFMDPWFRERTRQEIVDRAQEAGMPFSYQIRTDEVMEDPQLVAREFFVTLDHPEAGALEYPTSCVRFDHDRPVLGRAPLLGEHTEEILCGELGVEPAEVERLRAEEVA
jgi:crotonobetainyl-CoA:carnitine CoA-transferase CaiB-like acyl-CoA transferase